MDHLRGQLADLPGRETPAGTVEMADEFAYHDPVDGSVAENQGIRIGFEGGDRMVFRLSGTGTSGATVRLYLEAFTNDPSDFGKDTEEALAGVIAAADEIAEIARICGRDAPDVKT